jgi:hypothetical protein
MTWFRSDLSIQWIDDFGPSNGAKKIALDLAVAFLHQSKQAIRKGGAMANRPGTSTSETT